MVSASSELLMYSLFIPIFGGEDTLCLGIDERCEENLLLCGDPGIRLTGSARVPEDRVLPWVAPKLSEGRSVLVTLSGTVDFASFDSAPSRTSSVAPSIFKFL